jgi:hypothetical protein
MATATVVSYQKVQLLNERIDQVPGLNKLGQVDTIGQSTVIDKVTLEPGVQKIVPEWVLENKHFQSLVEEGKAQAI